MIFIDNKYTSIYYLIIERSKQRLLNSYAEKHHIIPKSIGGTNDSVNIAVLTAREHFICHLLLVKMTSGKDRIKMIHAASAFLTWTTPTHNRKVKVNSKSFQKLKELRREVLQREMTKPENKKKSSDGAKKLWADSDYKQQASVKRALLWKDPVYISKMKNRPKPMKQVTILGIKYNSLKEAALSLGLDSSTVSKRCSSQHERFVDWNYI